MIACHVPFSVPPAVSNIRLDNTSPGTLLTQQLHSCQVILGCITSRAWGGSNPGGASCRVGAGLRRSSSSSSSGAGSAGDAGLLCAWKRCLLGRETAGFHQLKIAM